MRHSSRFFQNTGCEYFPCHQGADPATFNCLFCYCPPLFPEPVRRELVPQPRPQGLLRLSAPPSARRL